MEVGRRTDGASVADSRRANETRLIESLRQKNESYQISGPNPPFVTDGTSISKSSRPRWLFVTGRLAAEIVRTVVEKISGSAPFTPEIHVVGISVAALMHVGWLKRKLTIDQPYDRVIVPGWCQGELKELEAQFGIPFERGPKDILDLPGWLGGSRQEQIDLSRFDIEIVAEINHAPQLSLEEIQRQATALCRDGADMIDLGCIPGTSWDQVGDVVKALRDSGIRVSIDSFDRCEVEWATSAGAELVLSCNSTNRDWAAGLGAELIVIPDDPRDLSSMWETAEFLEKRHVPFRLDPILEPVGFGFAASLARYYETRRVAPESPVFMGIGNVTELSEVDSAGVNFLLAAICQELNIRSVLTTQVAHWCQSAVREFDLARRMVKHAIDQHVPPKRLSSGLVLLRDGRPQELGPEAIGHLSRQIRDGNFRIFVERGEIHVMNRDGYWRGRDPFELFDQFTATGAELDAPHAFYLGYELCKAVTALTLGKQYQQDQSLKWGFLTVPEVSAHDRRKATAESSEEPL